MATGLATALESDNMISDGARDGYQATSNVSNQRTHDRQHYHRLSDESVDGATTLDNAQTAHLLRTTVYRPF